MYMKNVNSCGNLFTAKKSLNLHKKTVQEGHKDYKCDTCGKSYSQAQNLRNHIRIGHDHERHKDYKCDSCGKLYSYNGLLKHHIPVVHDGRKDHKCEPCAKSFTSALKHPISR